MISPNKKKDIKKERNSGKFSKVKKRKKIIKKKK